MGNKIPVSAKPHEVAVLHLFFCFGSVKKVATFLHYKKTSTVYRILCKYNIRQRRQEKNVLISTTATVDAA